MISAIILAAGDSSRMGSPKALLKLGNRNFIEEVCVALSEAGIEDICAVLGSHHAAITGLWKRGSERIVINPEPEKGQISSLRCGLKDVPGNAEAVLICLVDQPLVKAGTIKKIIEAWSADRDSVIIPKFGKKRGHPIMMPGKYRPLCFQAPDDLGMHWITHHPSVKVSDVMVDDPGILKDFDTREEYEKIKADTK